MTTRIGTWVLRLMGPDDATDDENQKVHDDFVANIGETELSLSALTDDNYYVKIDDA